MVVTEGKRGLQCGFVVLEHGQSGANVRAWGDGLDLLGYAWVAGAELYEDTAEGVGIESLEETRKGERTPERFGPGAFMRWAGASERAW